MFLVVVVLLLSSAVVCLFPSYMAKIFSKDDQFVQGVVEASLPLASLMVTMNLSVALEVFLEIILHATPILIYIIGHCVKSWQNQAPAG